MKNPYKLLHIIVIHIILFFVFTTNSHSQEMLDNYNSFEELSLNEVNGVDYNIDLINRFSDITIIAIHGGKIEKGTTELAYNIAALGNYNYYSFIGIKPSNNFSLHIDSTKFDEPKLVQLLSQSKVAISIHGCKGKSNFTYLGGKNERLKSIISDNLRDARFRTQTPPIELSGVSNNNIVNKYTSKQGVQIEISRHLRDIFMKQGPKHILFKKYVEAITKSINSY